MLFESGFDNHIFWEAFYWVGGLMGGGVISEQQFVYKWLPFMTDCRKTAEVYPEE